MRPDFEKLKLLKEELCEKRLLIASYNKSMPWNKVQIVKVLSKLKNGKSRDPMD